MANHYATKFLLPLGVLTIIFAVVGFFVLDNFFYVVVIFFVLGLISIIPLTEWHLHKHFDKDGNPKKSSVGGKET